VRKEQRLEMSVLSIADSIAQEVIQKYSSNLESKAQNGRASIAFNKIYKSSSIQSREQSAILDE
jgi:hypothetical protein